jgi:hypothetical protein
VSENGQELYAEARRTAELEQIQPLSQLRYHYLLGLPIPVWATLNYKKELSFNSSLRYFSCVILLKRATTLAA